MDGLPHWREPYRVMICTVGRSVEITLVGGVRTERSSHITLRSQARPAGPVCTGHLFPLARCTARVPFRFSFTHPSQALPWARAGCGERKSTAHGAWGRAASARPSGHPAWSQGWKLSHETGDLQIWRRRPGHARLAPAGRLRSRAAPLARALREWQRASCPRGTSQSPSFLRFLADAGGRSECFTLLFPRSSRCATC